MSEEQPEIVEQVEIDYKALPCLQSLFSTLIISRSKNHMYLYELFKPINTYILAY